MSSLPGRRRKTVLVKTSDRRTHTSHFNRFTLAGRKSSVFETPVNNNSRR